MAGMRGTCPYRTLVLPRVGDDDATCPMEHMQAGPDSMMMCPMMKMMKPMGDARH